MVQIQDIRIHAPLVYAAGICFIIVDFLMVGFRIYARRLTGSKLAADDWLCISALVFVTAMCVTLIIETSIKGLGYASAVGDAGAGHPDANVAGWPTELIQIPALASIKLSFLFLYRRIFVKRVVSPFAVLVWVMITIVVCWAITYFFLLLFLCGTNFSAYWISSMTEETECLPTAPVHLSYAITDVITDIFTITLPLPEVWKLHMPARKKFAISAIFGLGAITCAMSIIRLAIYQGALTVQFDPDADFEYITTLTSYFSTLEIGLGLIAACLPVQYGLLRSEKVGSIMRSIQSLASLASGGSRSSNGTRGQNTHATRRPSTNFPQERLPRTGEGDIHSAGKSGIALSQVNLANASTADTESGVHSRSGEFEMDEER